MKKTKPKGSAAKGLVIQIAGSATEALAREMAAREQQDNWARAVADGIERGELPSAHDERQVIALILRNWADRPKQKKPARRGNPTFVKKIYDPDYVALSVGFRIGFGAEYDDAIFDTAAQFGVDESTITKIFRARRDAVAQWFVHSNLAHRVGAIRGE